MRRMLGALASVGGLVVADWGLWDWSISAGHGTVALVAGLAMAPLVVVLAWIVALALVAVVRISLSRAHDEMRTRSERPVRRPPSSVSPSGTDAAKPAQRPSERIAA